MPGSRATDPAGPRCKGSGARHAPVGRRRERADREADARGTPPRQIAIGMLNDVQCGDLIKLLWWDGDGLCLFAKRLERGRFVWPRAEQGVAVLTPAQLSMLLEGIDWRRPVRTAQPELAGGCSPARGQALRQSESAAILVRPNGWGRDSMSE